jgi:hypothetical protein
VKCSVVTNVTAARRGRASAGSGLSPRSLLSTSFRLRSRTQAESPKA